MKFRTSFNRKGLEKPKNFNPVDNVQRQYSDLCDINNIVDNYSSERVLPFKKNLLYADGVNVADFRNSFGIVQQLKDEFQQLPSQIRKEFNNDIFNYADVLASAYAKNPESINKLSNLGLLSPSNLTENVASSQSGDLVSVHSSPDDSKNLELGS